VLNVDQGVIVGWYKYGPRYEGRSKVPPVTVLPKLGRWSDVAFLQWKEQARLRNKDVSNLRYIFSSDVSNTESHGILARALQSNPESLSAPSWAPNEDNCEEMYWEDRKVFTMDNARGKALLASPNGLGAAYMLIQHKSTFGEKTTIESVTVWCSDEDTNLLNFLFIVKKE
jgi:hypothetical protein